MKTITGLILIAGILYLSSGCRRGEIPPEFRDAVTAHGRSELLFDAGWRFHKGDTSQAGKTDFDDSSWRLLDLPHDWSIEDLPGKNTPIDSLAPGGIDAGYLVGGTGWYRKTFSLPSGLKNKLIYLRFDGVYMNSEIWVNGQLVGNHPYGYTSFKYDITRYLSAGRKNLIAVKVNNKGRNSRWYSGSGIYRHVWLTVISPVHLDPWKIFVTTPDADSTKATVRIRSSLVDDSRAGTNAIAITRIYDPKGKKLGQEERRTSIEPGGEVVADTEFRLQFPYLWSPETPEMYTVSVELVVEGGEGRRVPTDRIESKFGIRTITVSSAEGLKINGRRIMLKGGCMHHDNGPLGAAAFDRAEERKVELMKACGFNAIRCAHNPPSPAFLDACDRLGILVIDEAFDMWQEGKNPDDYHQWFRDWWQRDIESMVMRDRNHPSVIFWSIGNEIPERGKPEGAKLASEIAGKVRELDPSRLVTSAVNSVGQDKDQYFSKIDICGYNYEKDKYESDHKRLPDRIIYGSESFPLESYDYWIEVLDHPWVIGDFVWTGFDYLGEASIGWLGYPHEGSFYPWTHAYCGDIDICGFRRPQSYYREVLWKDSAALSIFVHPPVPSFPLNPKKEKWSKWEWQDVVASWNWSGYEGKNLQVEAYSSCPQTELFLNGKSQGKKTTNRQSQWLARWDVKYVPGVLEIKGYKNGRTVARSELRSAGEPFKLKLIPDRTLIQAGRHDLSFVTVEVTDRDGLRNPVASNLLKFSVSGPGTVLSVGSSDPMGTESFKRPYRKAYQGRCIVVIMGEKNSGEIRLKASSDGLEGAETIIKNL